MTKLVQVQGINELAARLRGLSDGKIKRATVAALNDGARAGYDAARREMGSVFDRPTRWTLGAVAYWKAGLEGSSVRQPGVFDERLRPQSMRLAGDRLFSKVDLTGEENKQDVKPENWLRPGIDGGDRRLKRHEIALQRVGVLPQGMFIVPGEAAQIDASGNMASSQINQIIAWFSGFAEQGYKSNMTDRTRQRFAKGRKNSRGFEYVAILRHRSLPAGIYMRTSFALPGIRKSSTVASSLKPVMIFVKAPSYRRRFDFDGVVSKAARSQFDRSLDAYLATMLKERAL